MPNKYTVTEVQAMKKRGLKTMDIPEDVANLPLLGNESMLEKFYAEALVTMGLRDIQVNVHVEKEASLIETRQNLYEEAKEVFGWILDPEDPDYDEQDSSSDDSYLCSELKDIKVALEQLSAITVGSALASACERCGMTPLDVVHEYTIESLLDNNRFDEWLSYNPGEPFVWKISVFDNSVSPDR